MGFWDWFRRRKTPVTKPQAPPEPVKLRPIPRPPVHTAPQPKVIPVESKKVVAEPPRVLPKVLIRAPAVEPVVEQPKPQRKTNWCGKCGKGFYSEQAYLEHKCIKRYHLTPTQSMEELGHGSNSGTMRVK